MIGEVAAAERAPATGVAPAPILRGFRFELVKLLSQWPVRVALLACWIGPGLIVAAISGQSSLPSDTVFGRWMHQSGWAGPLVVLAFSGSWLLPILASLVAGDVFASEDRLGTWRHLLVAVRSPRRIFAAKTLASLTIVLALAVGLTASGIVGGLAAVGDQPLVGLDGHLLSSQSAAGAVLLAWACALAPTLTFAGLGLLGSVAFGRTPLGLVIPAVLALVLQIVQVLPLPVAVRLALPSNAFIAYRGLFTDPAQTGPLLIGIAVSLVLAAGAGALAYRLFMRRDFTDLAYDGIGRRVLLGAVAPLVALFAVAVAVIALTTSAPHSGIDGAKLDRSVATAFGHLYRLQAAELHRPAVAESQLRTRASCGKAGPFTPDTGAGNDWRCVVRWHLPRTDAVGSAVYQLNVTPDGRYEADGDGPQEVNGFFQVHTPTGDSPNPLWQFDGLLDLIAAPSRS